MDKLRHLRLAASLFMLALLAGCAAKKTAGPPLPPAQAPTAAASPEPTPQPSPAPAQQSQLPAQGTPPPEPDQTQPAESKNDQKPNAKHGGRKSSSTQGGTRETAKNSKIVVRPDAEPPASGGQISPGGADVARGEPSTDQLLQSTENNLNNLKGQLSSEEQATITQIRDYINQSRQATRDNDTARAHNLALKAHLTCDDLIKRRQ